ncbi:hypothetical protein HNQ94_000811 [Salirhabdus euzebyi]|uniref:Rhodanese domain-containing protein n=1 Tax=Salirhabdus euzebyi TaxID=394506 RepID=A0A841PXV9_9BACI|nr:hypothetical protein [Salirhabdus euzebyi]MBB6452366.1 hypothetical protein [Salirhabdus euzebyi]
MLYIGIGLLIIALYFLYARYFPIYGVPCMEHLTIKEGVLLIDVRDYIDASSDPIAGSKNIPLAYLKRNIQDVVGQEIYVIAADRLEKNIGIRLLQRNGLKVAGYKLTTCKCFEKVNSPA